MTDPQREELIRAACDARQRAYAPYSNFRVGAAVLVDAGEIFAGCNVENASYGLSLCAERVALTAAVTGGYQRYSALAVAAAGAKPPCGACRQFLAEFADELLIMLIDAEQQDRVTQLRLCDLLPNAFRLDD